jgi:hypothetical protein
VVKGKLGDPVTVRKVSFAHVTDGLSQTAMILERAGLPDHYFDAGAAMEPHEPPQFRTWGNVGLWAISAEMLVNHLRHEADVPLVNGDNLHGVYSFHPGGAYVALADGAVQFIAESIRAEELLALVSRDQGETVALAAAH